MAKSHADDDGSARARIDETIAELGDFVGEDAHDAARRLTTGPGS
jgi:hypothetical protein